MLSMECNCSQKGHSAPIKVLEVSENAIEKVVDILSDYNRIYMVADKNTYEVAGKKVEKMLKEAGKLSHICIIDEPALPTNANVGKVLIEAGIDRENYDINAFSYNPDYILAVGSGSVNDICRMVSYRMGLEYGVVGTAPSMDGYVSVVAPLINGNRKIVYTCSVARHIIIDLNICAGAPYELLLAGVGDMIGKYVAILDWELSQKLTGEYYCEKVANMVLEATEKCITSAVSLKEREIETIENTIDGLILSGLGIAYTGSSRPASGTEHMVGQTWEIMDVEKGKVPNLHGVEVGEATFAAIVMYKKLYEETNETWLKELIGKYIPAFEKILELQKQIKIPFTVTDKDKFIEGVLRGRTFRVRYTLLQYLYDRGQLQEYAEFAYEETMKYNVG
ncbi:MAG: sn-glycerol-1-phosphate dehydrogenase [Oscillospiraceae bacterium]|nr:sn-glycerol-1-phosphate dehydrogenase [Oscillospiraceae bacterium]